MPTLQQGSSGPDVKDLQQQLKDLDFDPNGVDGNFGPWVIRPQLSPQGSAAHRETSPNHWSLKRS